MKVVLAGSPRTGKSCLREHLKQAIISIAPHGPYPYVITANPDGEGSWYQTAAGRDREDAHQNRTRHKAPFSSDFARRVARHVRDCREELVLVDIGGIVSDENHRICRSASHIIITHTGNDDLALWRDFARELDLEVLAELRSVYEAAPGEEQHTLGPPFTGTVHRLERGETCVKHPTIEVLAGCIVGPRRPAPEEPLDGGDPRTYRISRRGSILEVGWGRPGLGHEIVRDVCDILDELQRQGELDGRGVLGINGPCSVAVSAVLTHHLAGRFDALATYDAAGGSYTVVVSHLPQWRVGDVVSEAGLNSDVHRAT